jgi:hypothetical protein
MTGAPTTSRCSCCLRGADARCRFCQLLAGGCEGGELGRADLIDLHRLTIEAAAGQAM